MLVRRTAVSVVLVLVAGLAAGTAQVASASTLTTAVVHVTSTVTVKNVGPHGHYERSVFSKITGVRAAVARRVLRMLNHTTLVATTPPSDQDPNQLELDDTVKLARADARYLTFHQLFSMFPWGAAHGIGTDDPLTFNRASGAPLNVSDWIKKGDQTKFLKALSVYSHAWLKAHASTYYSDPMFYDEGTKPQLTNFSSYEVTTKGWVIHFSPYQVAPYAAGLIHVTVPWSKLNGLLGLAHPTA